MNAQQLRLLFNHWVHLTQRERATNGFPEVVADLIEAGGFPKPSYEELVEAKGLVEKAQAELEAYNAEGGANLKRFGDASELMYRFDAVTADWTVPS